MVFVGFAALTISWILSFMEFAPWFVSSILRFSGIIPRKVSADFLRCKLFVVLSLEAEMQFRGLTGRALALFFALGANWVGFVVYDCILRLWETPISEARSGHPHLFLISDQSRPQLQLLCRDEV